MAPQPPRLGLTARAFLWNGVGYVDAHFFSLFSMPTHTPTLQDVIDVLHVFSKNVDEQFKHVDERFQQIDARFTRIEGTMATMEESMVTKAYLDERLTDLRGDLVVLVRKEDRKLGALVDALVERRVLDRKTGEQILSLEPFAHS